MKLEGFYGDGTATERGEIVAGAGTGELTALRGEMTYKANHTEQSHDLSLRYAWDESENNPTA